jgi:hypothetical protein
MRYDARTTTASTASSAMPCRDAHPDVRKPGLNQTYDNPPAPASARSLSIGDDAGVSASTVAWETARP